MWVRNTLFKVIRSNNLRFRGLTRRIWIFHCISIFVRYWWIISGIIRTPRHTIISDIMRLIIQTLPAIRRIILLLYKRECSHLRSNDEKEHHLICRLVDPLPGGGDHLINVGDRCRSTRTTAIWAWFPYAHCCRINNLKFVYALFQ